MNIEKSNTILDEGCDAYEIVCSICYEYVTTSEYNPNYISLLKTLRNSASESAPELDEIIAEILEALDLKKMEYDLEKMGHAQYELSKLIKQARGY